MIWQKFLQRLNPVVRDKQNITHVTYGNRKINYYIKKNKISKQDRKILKKYVETDCKLLCAVVTAANGFVRESVGDDVSEERVNVISAAYSLVGKVGYFWGGKSTAIGEDPSWGMHQHRFPQSEVKAPELFVPMVWTAVVLLPGQ